MPDAALLAIARATACALARIEMRLQAIEEHLARGEVSEPHTALVDAIREIFGTAAFTASGLLTIAREHPHGDLSLALEQVVDLNSPAPQIALGRLLRRLPDLEAVGGRRGALLFRLRDCGGGGPA